MGTVGIDRGGKGNDPAGERWNSWAVAHNLNAAAFEALAEAPLAINCGEALER